jgi:hypothetical protein
MKLPRLAPRVLPLLTLLLALPACDGTTTPETGPNVPALTSARSPEAIARAILADAEFNALVREITRNARTGNVPQDAATFVTGLKSARTVETMRRIMARHGVTAANTGAVGRAMGQIASELRLSKMNDCETIYHMTTATITANYFLAVANCGENQQCRDEAQATAVAGYATAVENYMTCMAP